MPELQHARRKKCGDVKEGTTAATSAGKVGMKRPLRSFKSWRSGATILLKKIGQIP